MKKIALAALLAFTLLPAASNAQVYVRVGPPAPIVERRPPPPERGYVWVGGYHRWDGARYVWVPRALGSSASSACGVGWPSLGAPARWLGAGRGALALAESDLSERARLRPRSLVYRVACCSFIRRADEEEFSVVIPGSQTGWTSTRLRPIDLAR